MLADGHHADGCEHLCRLADGLERAAQCQRVDDGGEHAHLVAAHTLKALCGSLEPAEDVAATDDDGHLDTRLDDFLDLVCILDGALKVDARPLLDGQRLAAELEQDAMIDWFHE